MMNRCRRYHFTQTLIHHLVRNSGLRYLSPNIFAIVNYHLLNGYEDTMNIKYKILAALVAEIFVMLATPVAATGVPGYLTDTSGAIVHDNYGECWHTGFWTPEMAVVGCDGKLAKMRQVIIPPPRITRLVLDTDTYFDFDKATLKHNAVDKLDDLVAKIRNWDDVQQVRITGHTDRVGSDAYNQDLSLRRAQAVNHYLIERGAVSRNRVTVESMGESQPVVTCEGVRSAALYKCLAPNRRVIIEVKTTSTAQ
jgi:OOP family OmpA-OmpF porin